MICLPPCWQHIRPGKSTGDKVISQLSTISWVDKSSILDLRVKEDRLNSQVFFLFTNEAGDVGGRIYFDGGNHVELINLDVRYSLTLSEALQELGEPEQVSAVMGSADVNYLEVLLLYPSKGYVVGVYKVPFRSEKISPSFAELRVDDVVSHILYFDPDSYEDIRQDRKLGNALNPYADVATQPWNGFGMITYGYPTPQPIPISTNSASE